MWTEPPPLQTSAISYSYHVWTNKIATRTGDEFIHGFFATTASPLQRQIKFNNQPTAIRISFRLWVRNGWLPSGTIKTHFENQVCNALFSLKLLTKNPDFCLIRRFGIPLSQNIFNAAQMITHPQTKKEPVSKILTLHPMFQKFCKEC